MINRYQKIYDAHYNYSIERGETDNRKKDEGNGEVKEKQLVLQNVIKSMKMYALKNYLQYVET